MMRLGLALLAVALAGTGPVLAQEAKASGGRAIALRLCGVCHVVADDQAVAPTLNPPAPSFVELAARPKITQAFLHDFLMKPHGAARSLTTMPGFLMPSAEADAVIAYLTGLNPGK